MEDFVVIVVNQIGGFDEGVAVSGQLFEDYWQCFGCVVGVVVKKHDAARFDLACDPCDNALNRRGIFPVKTVIIRYKSKEFSFSF